VADKPSDKRMTPAELRTIRRDLRLTQSEWGVRLGIKREHVAKLESGRATITPTIALLAAMIRDKECTPVIVNLRT
jgi:DNA-binding transcriptional regulator YiaG